jgi:hypothetical protein
MRITRSRSGDGRLASLRIKASLNRRYRGRWPGVAVRIGSQIGMGTIHYRYLMYDIENLKFVEYNRLYK